MSDVEITGFEPVDVLDPTVEAAQEATGPNPVLAIPDQVAAEPVTAGVVFRPITQDLAAALQDILPAYWDANHPSAPVFAKAKEALDAFKVSFKASASVM